MKTMLKLAALLSLLALTAQGKDYQLQTLEKAHGLFRSATNTTMYAAAASQYEFLITEEGIRNGNLFYTLGNAWFMAGDPGRAILNYRRAERYLPNNADVQHNLKAALELRTDLIPEKEMHPLAEKLLGWHFDTPTSFRWWSFAVCWIALWGAWFWMQRSTKKEARITVATTGVLSIFLMASLLSENLHNRRAVTGVITTREVLARKGDGNMYAPAFLEPLHSGTEFRRLENRGTWWQIELADGHTCWVPSQSADTIALASK